MQYIRKIFHPTNLSEASEVAFLHALKLVVMSEGALTLLHVAGKHQHIHSSHFPSVRLTLERWGVIPSGSTKEAVTDLGVFIHKVVSKPENPVRACQRYLDSHTVDLVVLSVHQQDSRMHWLQTSIGQPIVRNAGEMALIIPYGVKGFVSRQDGSVLLTRILIPIANQPQPQGVVDAVQVLVSTLRLTIGYVTLLYVGQQEDVPTLSLPSDSGWVWEQQCRTGEIVDTIVHEANTNAYDLVVMVTEGRHGFFDALRGSTTEQVLHHLKCPLLTVPKC